MGTIKIFWLLTVLSGIFLTWTSIEVLVESYKYYKRQKLFKIKILWENLDQLVILVIGLSFLYFSLVSDVFTGFETLNLCGI